jgi:starch synthase
VKVGGVVGMKKQTKKRGKNQVSPEKINKQEITEKVKKELPETIKCLLVSTEVVPFAKTGGLADVAGALPKELRALGVDVRVAMPYYHMMQDKFFDHDAHFVTSYNVQVGWRRQGVGVYYDDSIIPTYFLKSDAYFYREGFYGYDDDQERFAFFSIAVLDLLQHIDFVPDIIHCNDWQTGPICLLLKEKYSYDPRYSHIKSIFTIHNIQYQGVFGEEALEMLGIGYEYMTPRRIEFNGGISYMKAGLIYSDMINTVSPTYAEEIKTPGYAYGLDGLLGHALSNKLTGVLNGIDYERYDPLTDPFIYQNYDVHSLEKKKENKRAFQKEYGMEEKDSMMIGIISRLADQKGFDLLKQTIDHLWVVEKIMRLDVQLVLLGTGTQEYENMFKHIAYEYGNRAGIFLSFDEALAQKIYAAADVFLMPSGFEPCGLGQLMAMRYGTVPIVRKTGGLKDTVIHYNEETKEGTGFEFQDYSGYWLYRKIEEACDYYYNKPQDFRRIQENGMNADFSWNASAKAYKKLYENLLV